MTETRLSRFQSSTLHPAISIGLPFTFILSFITLITSGFRVGGFGAGVLAMVFVAQFEEVIVANILLKERAGFTARLRELIILTGVAYLVLALARHVPWSVRLQTDFLLVLHLAVVIFGWILTYAIHSRLRTREAFFRIVEGKKGDELHRVIRESAEFMGETRTNLLGVRRIAHVLFGFLLVMLLVQWLVGYPPTRVGFFLLCVYVSCYVITLTAVQAFIHEFYLTGDGLVLPSELLRRRALFAVAILAAALLVALLLSANRSILPYSLLSDFFNWLSSILPRGKPAQIPPPPDQASPPDMSLLQQLMQDADQREPSQFLIHLLAILRVVGIAAIIGVVLLFVFGPFVSRSFADFLKNAHPLRTLLRKLTGLLQYARRRMRGLVAALGSLLRVIRALFRRDAARDTDIRAEGDRIFRTPPRPVAAKRKELDRARREFQRIVDWGSERGVAMGVGRTAGEFARELITVERTRTEIAGLLDDAVGIFEEAIYSDHIVGNDRLVRLHHCVDSIVAEP